VVSEQGNGGLGLFAEAVDGASCDGEDLRHD
jgi:hypothetical protein